MKNNNETRRFSIRKYTVGVVSIITGITIFISGQHAQAAEMTQSSSDSNEQSQQTEQVEQKEDTTHLSYELNQEGETASQSKTSQENQSDGNVQKKNNQIQQDSTQTSPLNDQKQTSMEQQSKDNHVTPNSRQDTYPKGQNQDDKGKQQFKDNQHSQTEHQPNTQNQNNDQDSSDKKQHPSDQTQDSSSKGTQPKQSQSIEDRDKTVKQPSSKVHKIGNTKTDKTVKTNQKKQTSLTSPRVVKSKQTKHINQLTAQAQYKNQYPVVFVHGFVGLVGEDAFSMYPNYWGGTKYNVKQELTKLGYRVHEANVGAFSSNYDRAVELYYYIKGGRVDYGAAHAAKYGHKRYGRTYEGIMPDWEPGKKIHLVGHSMGGQTIRLMEHFLRNGNQEEIDYQRQYGGTVSDLFKGGQDNMVSTITTLGTPHNGTPAADKLGSTKFIKDTINRIGKIGGTKALDLELGFSQWGFKQQPNESYAEYAKRIANSKVWETEDQAVNDLTTAGAEKLNQMTTLNPNIVYTSYTGAATHTGPLGNEVPNIRQFPLFDLTSRVIGGDDNKNVRVNDGIVPVSSSLHPSDEAFKKVGMMNLATDKGIWQVRPVQYDWDHLDLVGLDTTDYKRTGEELGQFYMSMINNMLKVEELDGITRK
ncbi:YSIRK domain-containing triacylglycerol lipase GehD [Staphylococcus epidermidis]|uniref:YSIRK domain-containing triacylglycerol lipase GehD n=1 Tax=Staphylococcus epidermidis TaxID=1282 RepID=UPI002878E1E7|nr:YSIRK domain-containing triacylglycerol lipase GehD [Staphylococcus epidermidis]MDS3976643.1 YSIRK domain-containing triacylglycerol lipase GehD [Staphylococcus epidermidis]